MFFYIIFIILGFWLLIKGADYLVDGASNVAKKFYIPTIIIGLTIVAIGTSMPEMMVSTTSILKGHSDMSIGNVVGSNNVNLFLILGICSIITPLFFKRETEKYENIIAIFATIVLTFFGNNGNTNLITRIEGLALLMCCTCFIMYNILMSKKRRNKEIIDMQDDAKEISILKAIFSIIIGIGALKIGGDVVVKYASRVARIMGLSEKLISVTIIAFSTSLPELITSVNATLKGDTDMAIGNILGSQIFNIFLIIGTTALISPINYSTQYNIDMAFLIFGTSLFALFPFIGKKHYMTRINGIIFVLIYIFYIVYNILKVIWKNKKLLYFIHKYDIIKKI